MHAARLANLPEQVDIMHAQYDEHVAPSGSVVHSTAHVRVLGLQAPQVQSVGAMQPSPASHLVVQVPPQSTSVSVPFWTPSSHAGAAQVYVPGSQTRLAQCAPWVHSTQVPSPSQ